MVFIESSVFSKRLQDLAGSDALDILNQIQTELLANPERGSLLKGLGGVRKKCDILTQRGKKESGEDIDTSSCI